MRFEELATQHAPLVLGLIKDLAATEPAVAAGWFDGVADAGDFKAFVARAAVERRDWRPKAKQISTTRYVLYDSTGLLGFGILRFPLDDTVESTGGNVVAIVPPDRRGAGWGTVTLNRTLHEAARAGLARARVTCAEANAPARRAIERNGGALNDVHAGLARYWIPLR